MSLNRIESNNLAALKRVENIVKSPQDKRLYRGLTLNNGLKILLISDSETDKSAASITVNTGSLHEPREIQGLAHFLEHMLFLGTEKYKDENEYQKFVSEHGGSSNAYTMDYRTCYYFDISPEHLTSALDRFAQFFLQPLFTESATDREAKAVNSEHERNISVDGWRIIQLIKSISSPNHDYNHFGTGNLETLDKVPKEKGINVRQELIKFHDSFYSSNIMCLTVLGKESLDSLETLVTDLFSGVANKNVMVPRYKESPFTKNELKKMLYITPVKDIRILKVIFPVPDVTEYYKTMPDFHVSNLIGHEGPGSLHSVLREKKWCNGLSSEVGCLAPGIGLFTITIDLTIEAMERINDIIKLIFQLLKKDGIQEWIFEENRKIEKITFTFKDKENPSSYVRNLSSAMQDYPLEDVLQAHYELTEWKPDLIKQLIDCLNPDNMIAVVVSKSYEDISTETERWYGTKYCLKNISPEIIQEWKSPQLTDKLSLPPPNEFIPENFDLFPKDGKVAQYPYILHESAVSRIWYKQDDEYLLPKNDVTLELFSPLAFLDPKHCVMCSIFVKLLKDALNEYAYSASLAGLTWNISNTRYGLMLTVSGYNEKLPVLLKKIFDLMKNLEVSDRFNVIRETVIRGLRNFDAEQPYIHSSFYLGILLSERAWSKQEQLEAGLSIKLNDVEQFIPNMMNNVFIQALIHGNCDRKAALEIVNIMEEPFRCLPGLLPQQLVYNREVQLDNGCSYLYNVSTKHHSSSCVQTYYQCSLESEENNVVIELFSQIMSEPCFTVLRTQEQLGYIVSSGVRRYNGVQGYSVLIQSDKHPIYVNDRIEKFLNSVGELLENMSEDEFSLHKKSLADKRLEKPKRMAVLSTKFFSEITSRCYNFDRANIEVAHLNKLEKDDIIKFYKELISTVSEKRRKIAVYVTSEMTNPQVPESTTAEKVEEIIDVVSFKSCHSLCPLPKSYINLPPMGAKSKL